MGLVIHLYLVITISTVYSVFAEITTVEKNWNISDGVEIVNVNNVSDVYTTILPPNLNKSECETGSANDVNGVQCHLEKNTKLDNENTVTKIVQKTTPNPYSEGLFGGHYYNGTNNTYYFAHGKYIKPIYDYYGNYKHSLKDMSTLGYYLGFAMSKMNRNEYFEHHNFTHFDIHHFHYKNNTMLPDLTVGSENIVPCAPNTSTLCPENTEAICHLNTTVWCATRHSFLQDCVDIELKKCVRTRLPCVRREDLDCESVVMVAHVTLPCISTIEITDATQDRQGQYLANVAGTFVLAPIQPIEDRTYCITIVAEPSGN